MILIIIVVERVIFMNFLDKDINEWYIIVKPIITNPEFQKRKKYMHHGTISAYDHVLNVSMLAYKMAKKRNLDYKSAAIAGILHDFYESPWTEDTESKPFFKRHAFTHAANALENSKKYFKEYLNPSIENAILRHMFPLNINPPKHKIGWIITLADKIISIEAIHEMAFFKSLFKGVIK